MKGYFSYNDEISLRLIIYSICYQKNIEDIYMKQEKTLNSKITTLDTSNHSLESYEEKLQYAYQMNIKLKQLFQAIKNNHLKRKREIHQNTEVMPEQIQLNKLKKQQAKLQTEIQQLINNLNVLISENAKLKSEVDSSRNSRLIYSNVYKNIEKEIRKHEYMYRLAIIDLLEYEEVQTKLKEKINKTVKKLQKQVTDIEGGAYKVIKRKEKGKRKSRLDTGLTGGQSTQRMQSVQNTQNPNQNELRSNSRRNNKSQQSHFEPIKLKSSTSTEKKEVNQTVENTKREESKKLPSHPIMEKKQSDTTTKKEQKTITDLYQFQMKATYYENTIKHLKEISELEEIKDISHLWKNVDNDIQEQYKTYLEYEEKMKELDEKDEELLKELAAQPGTSKQIKTVQEESYQKILEEIAREKTLLEQNQQKLTKIMDINTHKLTDEDIHHHVLRIKRKGEVSNHELQRLLENVRKQKNSNPNSLKASRLGEH